MLSLLDVFDNLFSDPRFTPVRFRNFCRFLLTNLTNANTDGKYDDAIVKVQAVLDALKQQISDVKTGVTQQVNSTSEMTQFIYGFGQYMKNASGAIAFNLGGKDTAAYKEFYPYKPEEYYRASKTTMPDLTVQVAGAAKKYAEQLGIKLATDLQAFAPAFDKIVNNQETQMGAVTQDRKDRNTLFTKGQWTLTGVVHDVASLNNGNPQESKNLFPFTTLFPPKKSNVVTSTGKLEVNESYEVQNRLLTTDVTLTVQNMVVNADVMVWLAATPKDEAPETAVVVNANTKSTYKAGDLGDLKNPFLMIKNMSSMNEASFTIDIAGMKREPKKKVEKPAAKEEKPAAGNSGEIHVAS